MTNATIHCSKEVRILPAVFLTEFIVILIINVFTIIVFARNRHLRKRSTCLIINLTVADLLVGAVTVPLDISLSDILERDLKLGEGFSWQPFIILVFKILFQVASLVNITLISLERLHATIYPFRHCLIGDGVYFKTILCSWFIALLLSLVLAFLFLSEAVVFLYVFPSCIFLTLLILTVSYVIIILNVKSNPHSQNFGSKLSAERKLTVTLFIVTVISYLAILPRAVGYTILRDMWKKLPPTAYFRICVTTSVLYYANSMVNPIIYAIRMEEFRKAAKELICVRTPESVRAEPIELRTQ